LEVTSRDSGGEVVTGELRAQDGATYTVEGGIPRFVRTEDAGQAQIAESFGQKWAEWNAVETSASLAVVRAWLLKRYFHGSDAELNRFMRGRARVLDAGCGSGMSSSLMLSEGYGGELWVGADISGAVEIARSKLRAIDKAEFVQADMMSLPFRRQSFDTVLAEGTLHHTPSTRSALLKLTEHLEVGGEFLFYVYRRKGPVREYVDDYVRQQIAGLSPDKAAKALRPITMLAKSLSELRQTVVVPDIPLLGVTAGEYDVQRFFYWHVAKAYWNDAMSFEENNLVNLDWYHPQYAHRQSEEELVAWCDEAGLLIQELDREDAGFTVRARRAA
jgi:SAM-dependent methyltransferase